jgi:hypothetical protein
MSSMAQAGSAPEQDKELSIKVLFASLVEKGIAIVEIDFDGSGDSGSIEEDNAKFYQAGNDGELTLIEDENLISEDIQKQLIKLGYHILDRYYDYDWYNNEGGYGTININLQERKWDIEGYQRVESVEEANGDGELEEALASFIKN